MWLHFKAELQTSARETSAREARYEAVAACLLQRPKQIFQRKTKQQIGSGQSDACSCWEPMEACINNFLVPKIPKIPVWTAS